MAEITYLERFKRKITYGDSKNRSEW